MNTSQAIKEQSRISSTTNQFKTTTDTNNVVVETRSITTRVCDTLLSAIYIGLALGITIVVLTMIFVAVQGVILELIK